MRRINMDTNNNGYTQTQLNFYVMRRKNLVTILRN